MRVRELRSKMYERSENSNQEKQNKLVMNVKDRDMRTEKIGEILKLKLAWF